MTEINACLWVVITCSTSPSIVLILMSFLRFEMDFKFLYTVEIFSESLFSLLPYVEKQLHYMSFM